MSEFAIEVQGLSKQYRIGARRRATTLRDELAGLLRQPFSHAGADGESFWALRDVSFSVRRGEIVGICGRNGAGKSTLLKILSRIVEPTRGRVCLRGRVSSLLEVGTGFHDELTGRENIFLNGALLGMKQREVEDRLDVIVAFSGVEKFLDTPVKHYSSGMKARLGFAVAAHLDQEILILDEVLAVGDANFQRKCLDRVNEIAGDDKTILMVSHNTFAVERFCSRAILLSDGQLVDDGPPRRIIDQYLADSTISVHDTAGQGDEIVVNRVAVTTDSEPGRLRGTLTVVVDVECLKPLDQLACGIGINNSAGHPLAHATANFQSVASGRRRLTIDLANPGLPPGDYSLAIAAMRRGGWIKFFQRAASFRIPSCVTDDPHMLNQLDSSGIALLVTRATEVGPDAH